MDKWNDLQNRVIIGSNPIMPSIYIIMDYKNTEVRLSINLQSAMATSGQFTSMPKVDDNGKMIFEVWSNPLNNSIERLPVYQLKITQLPRFHNCEQHTTLNGAFCAWAVSDDARPKKTVSMPWWNKLSKTNKLKMAIAQYVTDLYGQNAEYSFQIIGD